MCAPYVKCCVGSVTARAGHEPYLPYLPRISKYSYVMLARRRAERIHASPACVCIGSDVCVDVRMNVRQTREVNTGVEEGRRERLPPVKPTDAVVLLCCGTLLAGKGGLILSLP